MSNAVSINIPEELHCPVCVPFDGGFKCNELVCQGLQFKTTYTSETLEDFDDQILGGVIYANN